MLASGAPEFICGSRYTIADVQLYTFLSWALGEGGPQPDVLDDTSLEWVPKWYERIHGRPAAAVADPSRAASL
jgi:glutathione S-transferase